MAKGGAFWDETETRVNRDNETTQDQPTLV